MLKFQASLHTSLLHGSGAQERDLFLAGARSSRAVALRKGKSNWLFDCGEDTQRQLLKQALVRPGKIDRVFVTRASGDSAFGLPGMHQHFLSVTCISYIIFASLLPMS